MCPAGQWCAAGATTSVPSLVRAICNPGYYCPAGTNNATEYPCPAGTYQPNYGAIGPGDCKLCPAVRASGSAVALSRLVALVQYQQHAEHPCASDAGLLLCQCYRCLLGVSVPSGILLS